MGRTVCRDCGQSTDRDAEFCSHCGAFLEWSAVEGDRDAPPVGVAPVADRPAATAGATASEATSPTAPGSASTVVGAPVSLGAGAAREAGGCRRCGTDNPPGRRFCRKCALEFDPPAAAGWTSRGRRPRLPWWRRWLGGHRTPAERRALRAYRRSLPVRYRVFRALAALLVVGLVAAAVWAVRGNPIRWAQARWYDYHDTMEPLRDVDAALDPAGAQARTDFDPGRAVDEQPGTAWATVWGAGDPPLPCSGQQRTAERLVLTFPGGLADVRALEVRAGLPQDDPARGQQHRPAVLEVRSSDGTCQEIRLEDVASVQGVPLDPPVSTDVLLVDVVDVYPAPPGTSDLVAISEITPQRRPPH